MSDYSKPPPSHTTGQGAAPPPDPPGVLFTAPLANWPRRTAATAIDFLATIWLPSRLPTGLGTVLVILLVGFNSVFMQTRTNQSFGKVLLGIYLVWPVDLPGRTNVSFARASMPRNALRMVAHLLDIIVFIGFLRPLWNARRQTFADSLSSTVVVADAYDTLSAPPPGSRSSL